MELNHHVWICRPFPFGFRAISHNIKCKQGRENTSCDPPCSIAPRRAQNTDMPTELIDVRLWHSANYEAHARSVEELLVNSSPVDGSGLSTRDPKYCRMSLGGVVPHGNIMAAKF
jgi:hypothetical protein